MDPVSVSLVTKLTSTGVNYLQNLLSGKSAEQKAVEYDLSAATNEIEKAMNINGFAFRGGFISQAQALEIYEMLWDRLVHIADLARPYTAAQAYRTIADRDYGGKFANIWRGLFRDEWILGIPADQMSNGYVVPEWRWDVDLGDFKYGAEPTSLIPAMPSPNVIANSTPEEAGMGASEGGIANTSLKWIGGLVAAWWLLS